mmetsp:Transcript_87262/g.244902  ORF Transcript_87262/g.244902 Transcript_87262/m.244902 type:complete len:225 (-) Transcript_87262:221-895(-)
MSGLPRHAADDDGMSMRSRLSGPADRGSRSSAGGRSGVSSRHLSDMEVSHSRSMPQLNMGACSMGNRSMRMSLAGPLPYSHSVELGHLAVNNIPGYTGYIPGKASENVIGATHCRGNALSLCATNRRGEEPADDFVMRKNPYGLCTRRRGADVSGYTGHIPAKHATGVYGTTFANSNAVATQVRREQAVRRSHRPPILPDGGPLSWTGMVGAFKAAEANQLARN